MHTQILAPLPIGFAVFLVHLATIPVTGTGINPARSLGAAVIYNNEQAWKDHVTITFFLLFTLFIYDSFNIVNVDAKCDYLWFWYSGYSGLDHSLAQL